MKLCDYVLCSLFKWDAGGCSNSSSSSSNRRLEASVWNNMIVDGEKERKKIQLL